MMAGHPECRQPLCPACNHHRAAVANWERMKWTMATLVITFSVLAGAEQVWA